MENKRKPSLRYLLLIPLTLLVDLGLLLLGVKLDTILFSGSTTLGHGFPVFTLLAVLLIIIITIAMLIQIIATTIRRIRNRRNT